MKIVMSSDWHPDAVTAGYRRFDDVCASARAVADAAVKLGADLFVFCGDLCDPDLGRAHQCAALTIEIAAMLHREGIQSRWLVGNHDVLEDGTGTSTLEPLKAYAETTYCETEEEPVGRHYVAVRSMPCWESFSKELLLVALPYVARSHAYDPIAFIQPLGLAAHQRILVFGHLMLEGIEPGSETIDMARGRDLFFPIDEVLAKWGDRAVMVNGHYHQRQVHRGVQVIGSLERLTFGEENDEKGYSIIEI